MARRDDLPLSGVRVLELSQIMAGPTCGLMLSDMGAEVIKIETDGGETMRTRPPLRKGCSTVFGQLNVGKKSVVLDLKSEEGKEAVRRLAAAEQQARAAGDAPAEFELERLGAGGRELAAACDALYESRALRGG